MYGLSLDDKNLKPVHRLKASISQINHLGRGDSIGYGHQTITDQNKTIATINIGYADGVMRILGNGKTNFVVKGQVVPTIGNICMDMLMLDISDTKGLKEGMEVEIFGDQIALENHAKAAKTISYELLSRLSSRIKKIYIKE